MAGTQVQFRRGTTAQTTAFTGAAGEMTVDTDKNVVVVHDGTTAGGFAGARADKVVDLTSNQTVAGTKTFSTSPVVPTAAASDNSTKAASTAYVDRVTAGRLINTIYYSVVSQTATITIAAPGVITGALGASSVPQNGSPIVFTTTGALPTGITAGVTYYVVNRNASTGTFQVSATQGGSAITTTGTQSGTHTINNPAYLKATNNPSFIITESWGGGGGSGGSVIAAYGTGGGGAGGYARQKLLSASLLTSEPVTVGAGGTAGTSAGTGGGAGGSSSFGTHTSATGGTGSTGNATGTSGSGLGGTGGGGVGGDLNTTGAAGINGNGNLSYGVGGAGGATLLGGNGVGAGGSTTGSNTAAAPGVAAAPNSGSGAGGAYAANSTAEAGGAGGSGLIIVYEYA